MILSNFAAIQHNNGTSTVSYTINNQRFDHILPTYRDLVRQIITNHINNIKVFITKFHTLNVDQLLNDTDCSQLIMYLPDQNDLIPGMHLTQNETLLWQQEQIIRAYNIKHKTDFTLKEVLLHDQETTTI